MLEILRLPSASASTAPRCLPRDPEDVGQRWPEAGSRADAGGGSISTDRRHCAHSFCPLGAPPGSKSQPAGLGRGVVLSPAARGRAARRPAGSGGKEGDSGGGIGVCEMAEQSSTPAPTAGGQIPAGPCSHTGAIAGSALMVSLRGHV